MAIEFVNSDLEVMFIVAIIFLALPWIATLLRIYVRAFMIKSFGWDDALMIASMMTFTVECGIVLVIGPQPKNMTFQQVQNLTVLILISSGFYLVTSVLFKLSLGIFFLRFLQEPWQRRTVIACMVIYSVVGVAFLILLNVQCGDPRSLLSNQISKHCGPWHILQPLNYLYASINTLSDWMFALIPISTIRTMNMPRRAKISASLLLGLGAIVSIASIVRMKYIEGLNVNVQLFPSPAIGTTSCIEMGLGMTAACLATLRPMFSSCMARAKSTLRRTYGNDSHAQTPGQSKNGTKDGSKKGDTNNTFASYGFGKGELMESFVEVEEREGELRVMGAQTNRRDVDQIREAA